MARVRSESSTIDQHFSNMRCAEKDVVAGVLLLIISVVCLTIGGMVVDADLRAQGHPTSACVGPFTMVKKDTVNDHRHVSVRAFQLNSTTNLTTQVTLVYPPLDPPDRWRLVVTQKSEVDNYVPGLAAQDGGIECRCNPDTHKCVTERLDMIVGYYVLLIFGVLLSLVFLVGLVCFEGKFAVVYDECL